MLIVIKNTATEKRPEMIRMIFLYLHMVDSSRPGEQTRATSAKVSPLSRNIESEVFHETSIRPVTNSKFVVKK